MTRVAYYLFRPSNEHPESPLTLKTPHMVWPKYPSGSSVSGYIGSRCASIVSRFLFCKTSTRETDGHLQSRRKQSMCNNFRR